ncbi:CLUMA_CG021068, isoform A [Clunio marinus]|uniref:CLUMA_CG021068, isoform A n=1 Tax=Clunio marinus TaxID=568069 RepID=A0A1J1J808_9DIPT|nr:CLUMA_CG021068, isoform A [Clunio marinus]
MITPEHQRSYENHQLILDHLDNHQVQKTQNAEVNSSHFYKKSNISSTSSPELRCIHPTHDFRAIYDSNQTYEDNFRVSSSEVIIDEMGPPPTPIKTIKIVSNEEPTSSIPDLGKFHGFL